MLLDGNDIRQLLKIRPGPIVGELLTALREAQVTGAAGTVDEASDFILKRKLKA